MEKIVDVDIEEKYKDMADYIQRNKSGGYTIDVGNLGSFDFNKFYEPRYDPKSNPFSTEATLTRSNPYYVLIEYHVIEKIDMLYGLELPVIKRKGLALDLIIDSNARAADIMDIVHREVVVSTELTEFTILTINSL